MKWVALTCIALIVAYVALVITGHPVEAMGLRNGCGMLAGLAALVVLARLFL